MRTPYQNRLPLRVVTAGEKKYAGAMTFKEFLAGLIAIGALASFGYRSSNLDCRPDAPWYSRSTNFDCEEAAARAGFAEKDEAEKRQADDGGTLLR